MQLVLIISLTEIAFFFNCNTSQWIWTLIIVSRILVTYFEHQNQFTYLSLQSSQRQKHKINIRHSQYVVWCLRCRVGSNHAFAVDDPVTVETIHFSILMEMGEPVACYGVYSWATYNSKYLKLLEEKMISQLLTQDIIKDYIKFVNGYSTKQILGPQWQENLIQDSWYTEKETASMLYLYLCESWSLKSLSSRFGVPIQTILRLSKRFKAELK